MQANHDSTHTVFKFQRYNEARSRTLDCLSDLRDGLSYAMRLALLVPPCACLLLSTVLANREIKNEKRKKEKLGCVL